MRGHARPDAPRAEVDGDAATVSGTVGWVPDAPGADVLVVTAVDGDGAVRALLVETGADGVQIEAVTRYDATRSLGHVRLDGAPATVLSAGEVELASAWYLAQGLLAAESLGAVESALEMSVAYAKERFTFGRAIGSYQAVKHSLVEVLRRQENARSLMYYAGWARQDAPAEFPLAASAARSAAGSALDYASRELVSVHGGIGATWEHDAPYWFRRAQLSRRLLGGAGAATDRVAGELLAQAERGVIGRRQRRSSVRLPIRFITGSSADRGVRRPAWAMRRCGSPVNDGPLAADHSVDPGVGDLLGILGEEVGHGGMELGDPGDIAELGVHRSRAQDGERDAGARQLGADPL